MTTAPKIIVVGDPRLGEMLAESGAAWTVQPVATTVTAMWDAIEAGSIDTDAVAVFFTDGTGTTPDELEYSVASFAAFSPTFVFADPARGAVIAERAKELAPSVQGGDPNAPVHILPITDWYQCLEIIQRVLAGQGLWPAAPAPAAAPASAMPQPPAPIPAGPAYNPATSGSVASPAQVRAYEQGSAYADFVVEQARTSIPKPPDAIPGQMTIACMSSKGGSGKSTTSLSLAGMIARASAAAGHPKKVVLVDLDTRDGQVGSLLGQFVPTALNIRVMPVWDQKSVKANLVHNSQLGIDALLAPVRPRNADDVGPEFYRQIIGVLQTTHDVVVLDCSVNYLDPLLGTAFAMSDEILFVTTLATTSVQGMARSLTELFADPADGGLGIPREKVGIVANQVLNNVGMGKDKLLKAALGTPLVGQIPSDQDAVLVATNSNKMHTLLKHPKLGPAYFRLAVNCLPGWDLAPVAAEQVQQPQAEASPEHKKKGFFGR